MPLYLGSNKMGITITKADLPTLVNEALASDLMFGKQLLDDDGNIVTGTFSLDDELATQNDLIAQIIIALQNKAVGGNVIATHDGNGNVTLMNVNSSSDGDGNIILE